VVSRIACLLLAAPLLLADPPDDEKTGPAELQGAWRLISIVSETGEAELPEPGPAIVIKKDRVLYGGEEIATLLSGADAKSREIDFHFGNKDRIYEGLCAIDGEKLKICLNRRDDGVKERPDSYSVDGHASWALLTFEKVKPDEIGPGAGFAGLVLRFDKEKNEVVVAEVLDGSPAKKAGLMKDDVLMAVGGAGVTDILQAVAAVRRAKPREELSLRIRRDGKEQDEKVKVGILPLGIILGLE
jgi:uncharacterized protein (TIGR03067 family)